LIILEVEVKARLKDLEAIKQKLVSLGAKFVAPVEQSDSYFKPKGFDKENQGPGDWIMRIRTSDKKSFLTLKTLTEALGAWHELETEISNPEQAKKILETMQLENVFTLNKQRTYGTIEDFELCLDNIKELGYYLEVALEASESKNSRQKIIDFLKEIGIKEKDIEKRGYGEIIGEKLGHKFKGMR
jgi:adenylate cyclase class 2